MITLTTQQIQEAFKKLPKDLQALYFSEDVADETEKIGEKHGLHIDQMGELSDEIGRMMLGFTTSAEFASHLVSRLNIDQAKAAAITADVNGEIFVKIRQALQNAPVETGEEPAAVAPSVTEEKVAKIFNLPKDETSTAPKPWDTDPYLAKP